MRPLCPAAFAVLVGSLASVGCLTTDQQKEPLVLGQDTRSALTAPGGGGSATAKAVRPAAFDPTATGGSGLSVQNSFNRTAPGAGTGSSTGSFVSTLPPSQVGLPPAITPPAVQGASYGERMTEPGRTSMPRAATPAPPPIQPDERSPFGPSRPKLDPPLNDPPLNVPPAKPIVMTTPPVTPTPDPSGPLRPVMPDLDRGGPLPAPALATPVTPPPAAPIPPALPAGPGPAAHEPLPVAPAPPTYVPSPTEAPIPGVQSPPKLPPAPPIRPQ